MASSASPLSAYNRNVLNPHRFLNYVNYPSLKIIVVSRLSGRPVLARYCNLSPFFLVMGPFNRRLKFVCLHIHTSKAAFSFEAAPLRRRFFTHSLESVPVSCINNFLIARNMVDFPWVLRSLKCVSRQRASSQQAMLSFSRSCMLSSFPRRYFCFLLSVSYGISELCC